MNRKIVRTVQGQRAVDGAGVRLVRVLGYDDVRDFDPFLMLDSFDSRDSRDYIAGFPMHPHRGIETVTYLIAGDIVHKDSLGNSGRILDGQAQWMTAGSGILHEEMPQPAERMLGFQLWLNLPQTDKMTEPKYYDITEEMVPKVQAGAATVRVIAGEYEGQRGAEPRHVQATLYDITLPKGESLTLHTKEDETAFVFTILGGAKVEDREVPEKTAVLLDRGTELHLSAPREEARVIYYAAKPLKEGIAWGGPIVMNTQEELRRAFEELRAGTFLRHEPTA